MRADFLSHTSEADQHDYSLHEELFAYLDGLLGPHSVDRFASAATRQPLLPPNGGRFCSQFFHPEAEWTNAFTVDWGGENNWIFPPVHLVGEAIRHLRSSAAEGSAGHSHRFQGPVGLLVVDGAGGEAGAGRPTSSASPPWGPLPPPSVPLDGSGASLEERP